MMFKIQNNIVDIPKDIFTDVGAHNRRIEAVVFVPAARVNCYKYSFVPTGAKNLGWVAHWCKEFKNAVIVHFIS